MSQDLGTTKRKPLTPTQRLATKQEVEAALAYDPATGIFTRKMKSGPRWAGLSAGRVDSHGHVQITLNGRRYMAHRLAWLLTYGEWPTAHIDHINGVRADNRIPNLRQASRQQNNSNVKRRADNTSGHKGVSLQKGRWRAQIQANGRKEHIGMFSTAEEAHTAYGARARELFGEFARLS